MHPSRGHPPHGTTPSPTDHSNPHVPIPASVPPSPPFFPMNPLTDRRLTESMIQYSPISHHHSIGSPSTYQDSVPWQYSSWDTPVLDAGVSSEDPSSSSLHALGGMVSASHDGGAYVPLLPPTSTVQARSHFFSATQACSFPTSPTLGSPEDTPESSLHFSANNVSASSAPPPPPPPPPPTVPHLPPQGSSIQTPFTSPSDIWSSHSAGAGVSVSPVTPTTVLVPPLIGGEKSKGVVRRSPTESSRGSLRFDPVGKQSRGTPRSGGAASEILTDDGEEERDSDGSVRDVRDKKRRYAKTFRDIEKHLFEKLRHRLFPQDPHAKRSECLERAINSVDELVQLRESEARRQKELEYLRRQLTDAERRIEHLYCELNGRTLPIGN